MTNNAEHQHQQALWDGTDELPRTRTRLTGRRSSGAATPATRPVTRPTTPMEFSELWTIEEVANYLGVPKQTVYCWRTSGYGPQGFRVGKHLRWRAATVIAWTLEMEQRQ